MVSNPDMPFPVKPRFVFCPILYSPMSSQVED